MQTNYTNTVLITRPTPQMVHFRNQQAASRFVTERRKHGEDCRVYRYDPARAFVDALIELRKEQVEA